jgi:YD repeat-containing protein
MDTVSIKIDGLAFDRVNYEADGDVLYLARGDSAVAADAALTPEGHGVRYDAAGKVIGVTITNARWLLDRDGQLTITLPHEVHIQARDLAAALA